MAKVLAGDCSAILILCCACLDADHGRREHGRSVYGQNKCRQIDAKRLDRLALAAGELQCHKDRCGRDMLDSATQLFQAPENLRSM
jgi:hypothetical protein